MSSELLFIAEKTSFFSSITLLGFSWHYHLLIYMYILYLNISSISYIYVHYEHPSISAFIASTTACI